MSTSVASLTSRALIRVTGPDWRSFLQGLIMQDVESLRPGELRYGALLTPQGRLSHDLFFSGEDDGGLLDVAAGAREALIAKLMLYRLRAKVQIEASDAPVIAAWGRQPEETGHRWLVDPRAPQLGFRAYSNAPAAEQILDDDAYQRHRLSFGVPDPVTDGAESDYPIELNLDLLNGIDFKKGCFIGQETTSRMHRRGVVKTRIAPIVFDGAAPPFGAEILAGERRAGEVRGGIDGRAMALLRIDRVRDATLTVDDRPVSLDLPPWLARYFEIQLDETGQP